MFWSFPMCNLQQAVFSQHIVIYRESDRRKKCIWEHCNPEKRAWFGDKTQLCFIFIYKVGRADLGSTVRWGVGVRVVRLGRAPQCRTWSMWKLGKIGVSMGESAPWLLWPICFLFLGKWKSGSPRAYSKNGFIIVVFNHLNRRVLFIFSSKICTPPPLCGMGGMKRNIKKAPSRESRS